MNDCWPIIMHALCVCCFFIWKYSLFPALYRRRKHACVVHLPLTAIIKFYYAFFVCPIQLIPWFAYVENSAKILASSIENRLKFQSCFVIRILGKRLVSIIYIWKYKTSYTRFNMFRIFLIKHKRSHSKIFIFNGHNF